MYFIKSFAKLLNYFENSYLFNKKFKSGCGQIESIGALPLLEMCSRI